MPPLPADSIHARACKLKCEKILTRPSEVETFGIDESWIELTGSPLLKERTPHEIADEIRNTVKSEVGLTVSIGISFNKIFAKLGSDMKKPDAVTEIGRDTFRDQVWPLPVSDLLYVGRATAEKLGRYCIRTIGDLANTERDILRSLLGINGEKSGHMPTVWTLPELCPVTIPRPSRV